MKKYFIGLVFLALLSPSLALGYYNLGQPNGFVNDYAGIISPTAKQELENTLATFQKDTTNEIAVVTIKSLQGDTIENFAVKLFEDWKIGKQDKDNGILILIAEQDRKMRIEVGYGLEGSLTDAQSYWIIKNLMTPAFKNGDYSGGISSAVDKIILAVRGESDIPSQSTGDEQDTKLDLESLFEFAIYIVFFVFVWLASILARSKSFWLGGVIGAVIGIVLIFVFSWIVGLISIIILTPLGLVFDYIVSKNYQKRKAAGKKPSWWAGGGFGGRSGGGFGGFGGGSSGGGGASGSW